MSDAAWDAIKEAQNQNTINSYLFSALTNLSYMATYNEVIKTYQDISNHKVINKYFCFSLHEDKIDLINTITRISQIEVCDRRFVIGGLIIEHFTI